MDATVLEQAGFPAATLEDWKKLTGKVLKGADFDQTLVTLTADGIAIQPLAQRRQAAEPLLASGAREKWTINQRVDDPDPDRAEHQIDADLANGASGLSLVFADSLSAYGTGIDQLSDTTIQKIATAKASIRIENAGSLKSVSWMASFL
ncbi:MAG: hypothetical protein RIR97_197, partial [Pseudomonadota bacterium]